jgi:uncharacterized protein YcnI
VRATALAAAALVALVAAAGATAHARISPPVSLSGEIQLYSLAVPTEESSTTTTKVVMVAPAGFSIDSFVPSPGWTRTVTTSTGAGGAVVQRVTWSGGAVPTGEDALFQFLGEPERSGAYSFDVEQTYGNGLVVDWSEAPTAQYPAPTIEAEASLGGGGGSSTLTIVALVVGVLGLIVATVALVARAGTRPLA